MIAAATRLRIPYLVVHGELDEAVAAEEARRLFEAAGAGEKRISVVPRAGHTFGAAHPWAGPPGPWEQAVGETADWFVRHLAPGSRSA